MTIYAQVPVRTRDSLGSQSHFIAECDVQFNAALAWTPASFKRVLLHEFGHCVGFGHPDEIGVNVSSVMMSGYRAPAAELTSLDVFWTRTLYQYHPQMETALKQLERFNRASRLARTRKRVQFKRLQRNLDRLVGLALVPVGVPGGALGSLRFAK